MKELLNSRHEKPRDELLSLLKKTWEVTSAFKVSHNRFSELKNIVETQIYDEDGDFELATQLLGFFCFTDKLAIEFSLRLVRDDRVNPAHLIKAFNQMISMMGGEVSPVISHESYLGLLHSLLLKIGGSEGDSGQFWSLIALCTDIMLLYKFGDCETYLHDSFLGTKDIPSLFVLARVFFDHATTLVERHQILKKALTDPDVLKTASFWGLLATTSLSKDGRAAIEEIGSLKQLSTDLREATQSSAEGTINHDIVLFKLSLFSRLAAMKPI